MRRRATPSLPLASRWLLLICPLMLISLMPQAQDTGQICVQSYEDRDGDGLRDADEAAIAGGIGASLRNAAGVTIASQLLEDSPFAAKGLICFDLLLAGDYSISLTSAEYNATTASSFAASVNPGAAPALFEFGARSLRAAQSSGESGAGFAIDPAALDSALRGLVGSFIVVMIMSVVGLLIYFLLFRRRLKRASMTRPPAPAPLPAGPPQQLLSPEPGRDRLAKHRPSAGSPPIFADEDTDAREGPPT